VKKYLFDTSIIIDHLRGVEEARKWIEMVKKNKILGIISVVTEAELLSAKRCENYVERKRISNLIKIFKKEELNNKIARKAAEYRRKYGVSMLDCIIAATAFFQRAIILTKNIEDFKRLPVKYIDPYP